MCVCTLFEGGDTNRKNMKNWLQNKEVLRSLLQQGDLANTINGGTTQTFVHTEEQSHRTIISVFSPHVDSNEFKVVLNKNTLSILRYLGEAFDFAGHEKWMVPVFAQSFQLPSNVTKESIEAVYEEGVLKVILPKEDEQKLNREIKIREV